VTNRRKVFGGNRTEAGARAQEVLASVFVSCAQRGQDALTYLAKLICSGAPLLAFARKQGGLLAKQIQDFLPEPRKLW